MFYGSFKELVSIAMQTIDAQEIINTFMSKILGGSNLVSTQNILKSRLYCLGIFI